MRLLPESANGQRFLALVLFLIALLLAYLLFVHWWFVAPYLAMREQYSDLREQQYHFAELIQNRPAIEKRLKDVAAFEQENQAFLPDADASSAFSDLSEHLNQIVNQNVDTATSRCQVLSLSPAQNHGDEIYKRVSAAVVMNCEPEVLAKIFYGLETANPYLFIDKPVLYRQAPVFQPGVKGLVAPRLLGVQFQLSGYLRESGKPAEVSKSKVRR